MRKTLAWIILLFLCSASLLVLKEPFLRFIPGTLLVFFLPGYGLTRFFFPTLDQLERLCISFTLSLSLSCLQFYLLIFLFPKVTPPILILSLTIWSVVIFSINMLKKNVAYPGCFNWTSFLWLFPILVLAAFFRFTYLGYSEFQGDEADNCLTNSMLVLEGERETLITQRRPPTQILMTAIESVIYNSRNEFLIRFPIALCGLFGVIVIYLMGRNMFNPRVGLVAAILAATNGYFIAFSRIVQYQSVVILSVSLSLMLFYKLLNASDKNEVIKYLLSGTFFFAFAVFTHFDGILALPAVLYIILCKLKTSKNLFPFLLISLLVFLFVTALFYLPFFLHPNFTNTAEGYKGERFSSLLNFHWDVLFRSGSLYNSLTYILFLMVFSAPAWIRKIDVATKVVSIWFLTNFIFFMIIMSWPMTHIYTFFAPWIILAALGLNRTIEFLELKLHWLSSKTIGCYILVFVLSIPLSAWSFHTYKVFIKHDPEYLWDQPYSNVPDYGLFGFPYYRGWKTVGYLFRTGELKGGYKSNEKDRITKYYLREKPSDSKYFIMVKNPQSWHKDAELSDNFAPAIQIEYAGKPTIIIYEYFEDISQARTQKLEGNILIYPSDEFERLYDRLDVEL